jgi:ABC-type uncharacterized transport system involved in gliding motility auxiliary subunit
VKIGEICGRIFDFLFPPRCVSCGREDFFVCEKCVSQIQIRPRAKFSRTRLKLPQLSRRRRQEKLAFRVKCSPQFFGEFGMRFVNFRPARAGRPKFAGACFSFVLKFSKPVDLKTNLSYAADVLRELKSRAGGNLRIENVDVADSNGQNAARSAGIPQISVTVREKDELKAQNAFLGLGIFYHGKSEIFPVLTANEVANFQYNFAIAILKLTSENSAKKRIAIVENHSSFGENDFKNLRKSLEKIYAVEKISLENAENFDALLVFSPAEKFTENEKFLLEQKILGGTPALFFLDKLPDVTKADAPPSLNSIETGLDDFFENWGLKISNELIADVSMDRLSYSQGFMRVMTSYPLFPLVTENTGGLNLNHPTTAGLGQV